MLPNPSEEPTITVERAGALCGLGRAAAYRAVRRGEIPSLRFGSRLVVPTRKVLALLGADTEPADVLGGDQRGALPDGHNN